jgi:predicted acylesterase/phospholipase RssA
MAETPVLYLAPLARTFDELSHSIEPMSWLHVQEIADRTHWVGAGVDLMFECVADAGEAARRVRERYYALVIVDCRQLPGTSRDQADCQVRVLHAFLELLRAERDPDRRMPFERVVVLIGGADVAHTDQLLFDAGAHHVGLCLRDDALVPALGPDAARRARASFLHGLWDLAQTVLSGRKVTRTALCAAGGGITGIYYELGVLKCLQDAFANFDVRDFDMFFGISAGAVVTSMLANQLSVDELLEQFDVRRGDDLGIEIKLRHLALGDIPFRLRATAEHLYSYLSRVRAGRERFNTGNFLWQLAAVIGPIFDAAEIERRIARFFERSGRTNDFRELERELYIGVTDQDAREHVLFGSEGFDDVPITKAVQASAAIHPFFRSVEIDGRRYTDGFVTRTSNLTGAVERGANLIFVIDPFLPMVSTNAGENARHGALWGVLQDYKTVAYTRFERVGDAILRQNPHVTCFTFVPSNRMRRLMGRNPMAATDYDAIVVEAYRSTYRRFASLEHRLGPRLEEHGIELDLRPVAETVDWLDRENLPSAELLLGPPEPPRRPRFAPLRRLRRAA